MDLVMSVTVRSWVGGSENGASRCSDASMRSEVVPSQAGLYGVWTLFQCKHDEDAKALLCRKSGAVFECRRFDYRVIPSNGVLCNVILKGQKDWLEVSKRYSVHGTSDALQFSELARAVIVLVQPQYGRPAADGRAWGQMRRRRVSPEAYRSIDLTQHVGSSGHVKVLHCHDRAARIISAQRSIAQFIQTSWYQGECLPISE